MAANMRAVFFASNRPGGLGGWDIWTSKWIPGTGYSAPYNLGSPVNSASDETDPSISGDGALLVFASNRSGGLGGFDLWSSALRPGWTSPVNLGPTVNSSSDEREPSLRTDHDYLMFASNRAGATAGWGIFESAITSVPAVAVPITEKHPLPTVRVLVLVALMAAIAALFVRRRKRAQA
jgi:WD40-like Beta Propeller Repeat